MEIYRVMTKAQSQTRRIRGILEKHGKRVVVSHKLSGVDHTYVFITPDGLVSLTGLVHDNSGELRLSPALEEAEIEKVLCGKEVTGIGVKIAHERACKSCRVLATQAHAEAQRLDAPAPYLPESAAIPVPHGGERRVNHTRPMPTPAEIEAKNGPVTVRHENVLHIEGTEGEEEPIVEILVEKPAVPYLKTVVNENTDEMVARLNDLMDEAMQLASRAEAAAHVVSGMKALFDERNELEARIAEIEARIKEGGLR
jgi:hypothetical protein